GDKAFTHGDVGVCSDRMRFTVTKEALDRGHRSFSRETALSGGGALRVRGSDHREAQDQAGQNRQQTHEEITRRNIGFTARAALVWSSQFRSVIPQKVPHVLPWHKIIAVHVS